MRGRDLGSTVAEAQARIAKNVKLPSGYRMVWAGEFGDLQEAKNVWRSLCRSASS